MTLKSSEDIISQHTSKNKLKISLIEPTIILHGSPEDSLGCFLRGELVLNLTKPTKIKRIELTFLGKIRLFFYYSEGETTSDSDSKEKEIISHTWTFLDNLQNSSDADSSYSQSIHNNKNLASRLFHSLPSKKSKKSKKYHILTKGCHVFPFELYLPGKLPETINTNLGRVTYKLSAKVLKSGIFSKLKKSQYVPILRTISDEWNQGKVVSNELKDICRYELSFLKKAFPIGDCINVEFRLMPKTPDEFELHYVNIDLIEKSSYDTSNTNGNVEYSESRSRSQTTTICGIRVNDFIEEWIDRRSGNNYIFKFDKKDNEIEIRQDESSEKWYHETFSFRLPDSQYLIHPTYISDLITISHDLKFLFCIRTFDNGQSKLKKFTIIVPIIIVASKCKDDVLPLYYESENDDNSTFSRASLDEVSLDDISLPPSYESSIAGSRNNSSVNLGVYN